MMSVPITALYAGLLGLVYVLVGLPIGVLRFRTGVSLHDGGNKALAVAIRRHANFFEYVPLALLLIAMLELNGASGALVHGLGIALLIARILHPFGLDYDEMRKPLRGLGAITTTIVIIVASVVLIYRTVLLWTLAASA
jgi:uncharacterized membrane protein YecN with MAPEG domain